MVLIPEVGRVTLECPQDDAAVVTAWAGIGKARRRLDAVGDGAFPREFAHARRLARSVVCLLGHLEHLESGGGRRERWLTVVYLTVLAVSGRCLVWSIAHGGG